MHGSSALELVAADNHTLANNSNPTNMQTTVYLMMPHLEQVFNQPRHTRVIDVIAALLGAEAAVKGEALGGAAAQLQERLLVDRLWFFLMCVHCLY